MIIERAPFNPSQETLRIIESFMNQISPDNTELIQWFYSYANGHKKRIAFDLEILQRHIPQKTRVLEIGSIPLLFTTALAKSGYEVTGIDIAPERFNSCIRQLELIVLKCDIEREVLPIQENIYDAVVFNEIFEHLRINPIFTMREVLRVMKPNGTLLLSSPNIWSLIGIRNFLLRKRAYSIAGDLYTEYGKLEKLGHMGHVREYSSIEVTDFLSKIGFVVEKLIYRGEYKSQEAKIIIRLFPTLRPFISYIARKPG